MSHMDGGPSPASFKIVPAIERAVQVLFAFKDGPEEYGASELVRALGVNRSSLFHVLRTLEHFGFLQYDNSTRKFRLGYALVELGNVVLSRTDLRALAKPFMQKLAHTTGENVVLSILDAGSVLIIAQEESRRKMRITSPTGTRLPILAAADGKVLLAWRQSREVDEALKASPNERRPGGHEPEEGTFRRELSSVREKGYAFDDEGYQRGVRGISAPVRNFKGEVVAAITIVGVGIADQRLTGLAGEVVDASRQISARLGLNPAT